MKRFILGLAVACVASCTGGTETDNPDTLTGFSSSACKKPNSGNGQQAFERVSDIDGLECVEWQRQSSGKLELKLYNFPAGCGERYLGNAELKQGALWLSVFKDTCSVYRCGSCIFDFDFQVAGVDASAALELHYGTAVCESKPTTYTDEVSLPIDEQESGLSCRFLPQTALGFGQTCGKRNLACCTGGPVPECETELSCVEVTAGDSRCLPACETDDDCVAGATSCQDGTCRALGDW